MRYAVLIPIAVLTVWFVVSAGRMFDNAQRGFESRIASFEVR